MPPKHLSNHHKCEEVLSCWRTRGAKPNEMDFDEVRRLSLYNFTDYRSNYEMMITDGFFLLKTIDNQNVDNQNSSVKYHVEMVNGNIIKGAYTSQLEKFINNGDHHHYTEQEN